MGQSSEKTDVLISVNEGERVGDVVHRLREKGVRISDDDWDDLGVISGSVDSRLDLPTLRQVEGVGHVREQRTFQLPPDNARVQ